MFVGKTKYKNVMKAILGSKKSNTKELTDIY